MRLYMGVLQALFRGILVVLLWLRCMYGYMYIPVYLSQAPSKGSGGWPFLCFDAPLLTKKGFKFQGLGTLNPKP